MTSPASHAGALRAPAHADWVDALIKARSTRVPAPLDPGIAAASLADAERVQMDHLGKVQAQLGGTVVGFKMGACNDAALDALGLGDPFCGPLLSTCMHESGAVLQRADFLVCVIEAEIGVRFGRDIAAGSAPLSRGDLAEAIDSVFPAIEIADARFENWAAGPASAIISDLGLAGAWVTGKDCPHWRTLDMVKLPVTLSLDGEVIREGSGAAVLGDPIDALRRVVTNMQRQGKSIAAGTLVSTGNWTAPYLAPAGGGRLVADFGPIGQVSVDLR
jgi:2-keto-4-pentenoate hydratase